MAFMKFKKINLNNLFGGYRTSGSFSGCSGCRTCRGNGDEGRRESGKNCTEHVSNLNTGKQSCLKNSTGAPGCSGADMRDRGNEPIVFDIRREAFMTPDYRTAIWTGGNLQLTVMTVPVGEETGTELHEGVDQLVGVVSGAGEVSFGNRENYFAPAIPLDAHSVVLVPSGTYHNIKNVGKTPLKLYSVYAPRVHKFGTVDKTNDE